MLGDDDTCFSQWGASQTQAAPWDWGPNQRHCHGLGRARSGSFFSPAARTGTRRHLPSGKISSLSRFCRSCTSSPSKIQKNCVSRSFTVYRNLRSLLFWSVRQRSVIGGYRRLGAPCGFHLQESSSPRRTNAAWHPQRAKTSTTSRRKPKIRVAEFLYQFSSNIKVRWTL